MKTHHLVLLVALTIASLAPAARAGDPGPAPLKLAHSPTTCLDVAQSSKADSAKVLRWACTGNDNQRWNLTPHKGHAKNLMITAAHSKKCLDVAGGATAPGSLVVQYKCHGSPHQLWRRVGFLSSGTFSLESVGAPGMCLDLGTADGNQATLQRCSLTKGNIKGRLGIKPQSFLSSTVPSPAPTTASPAKAPEAYRVVVVGDPSVHKTAFIVSAITGAPPGETVPLTLPPMTQDFVVDGVKATVTFVDTEGAPDYDRLRPLSYGGADLVIVMFSIANKASFDNIKAKWVPELKHHFAELPPLLLVGSHIGERSDAAAIQTLGTKGISLLSDDDRRRLVKDIGAERSLEVGVYVPSSASLAVDEVVRSIRNPKRKRR